MSDPWMQTVSGGAWPLLAPSPHLVDWRDVANALARACRYNGHLAEDVPPYSEAEHCCRVADILPLELRLPGLLHGAHKAFTPNVTAPQGEAIERLGGGEALRRLRALHEAPLFAAAGWPYPMPRDAETRILQADLRIEATEKRDLMAECRRSWRRLPDPLPGVIIPWAWHRAADEWLTRLYRWLPVALASAARKRGSL